MARCILCHFETVLDDVALRHDAGTCVCLGCYARETGSACPMPKSLRKAITAVLAEGSAPAATAVSQ